jgi:hypothetical protein
MNVSKAADRGLQARSGIAYLWVAAILAVLASAPALFARDILGGDWTEGIRLTQMLSAILKVMWLLVLFLYCACSADGINGAGQPAEFGACSVRRSFC